MQRGQRTHAKLTCPICHRLFTNPRTLGACRHNLCRICLDILLATHTPAPCPVCQHPISPECTTENPQLHQALRYYHDSIRIITQTTMGSYAPSDIGSVLSGSDTDLDLPEPSSFLELSGEQPDMSGKTQDILADIADTEAGDQEIEADAQEATSNILPAKSADVVPAEKPDVIKHPTARPPKRRATRSPHPPSKRQRRSIAPARKNDSTATLIEPSIPPTSSPAHPPSVNLAILLTGITDTQHRKLKQASARASTRLSWHITLHNQPTYLDNAVRRAKHSQRSDIFTYTHVLTVPDKDNRAARTFKYLAGLVSGAWVVRAEWLTDSVKARELLPESDYMVLGDTATMEYTLGGPRVPGELLKGYMFYVWGELDLGPGYPNTDALKLIRAAGGEVISHCPVAEPGELEEPDASEPQQISASCKQALTAVRGPDNLALFGIPVIRDRPAILIDNKLLATAKHSAELLDSLTKTTGGRVACRPKSWLFDCISANELLE